MFVKKLLGGLGARAPVPPLDPPLSVCVMQVMFASILGRLPKVDLIIFKLTS